MSTSSSARALERTLSASLLETERRIRAASIVRMHCSLVVAVSDGHAVWLAGERRGATTVYGAGADLAEAFADLFCNVARDAAKGGAR